MILLTTAGDVAVSQIGLIVSTAAVPTVVVGVAVLVPGGGVQAGGVVLGHPGHGLLSPLVGHGVLQLVQQTVQTLVTARP